MNSDFKELLHIFAEEEVRYLIVGGYAVIHHGQPRSTKDLDIWLQPCPENAARILRAFTRFGLPLMGGVVPEDFEKEGLQYAVGVPPSMVDFLTTVPGLDFESCWPNRVKAESEGVPYMFIGKQDLISAKKAAGRPQDIADLEGLS